MRIALFSPLPPLRSGISDYAAELLPHLRRHLEIELFQDDGYRPDPALAAAFPLHSHRDLPKLAARYDLVLYHLGNHPHFHGYIYRALLAHPGVVVLHEYMLHHLVRGVTAARGDVAAYLEEMRYAYGETGLALARRSLDTATPLDVWSFPLFERAVDASLGLIVHNECTRRRVHASRPSTPVALVPHHLSLDALPTPDAAASRARLARFGIPEGGLLLASFGMITPAKRLEVSLAAFSRLRREVPHAVYLLAGEVSPYYDLADLLERGAREGVVVTGHLDLPDLLAAMQACDVAINLRHPTGGETSGTLIRLLGLGKPVIVSDHGAFAELPDDCCAKVDLDGLEEETLLAYLRALAGDPVLRQRLGENARRHMAVHHSPEGSARGYVEFLSRLAAEPPAPFRAAPPLVRFPPHDVPSVLSAEVARELADLGIEDGDLAALGEVADAFVELGLDGDGRPTRGG